MLSCFPQSSRLGFRAWTPDDLPLARALWGDPQVTRFIGGPFGEEWIVERLAVEMTTQREHGMQYWPIFLLDTGAHVGCCGLTSWPYSRVEGALQLGVHLRPEHWNKGLAREASEAAMRYAFDLLHVAVLMAGHHPENQASHHLLRRLGFSYDQDVFYPPTGLQHPSYRLTAADYLVSGQGNPAERTTR